MRRAPLLLLTIIVLAGSGCRSGPPPVEAPSPVITPHTSTEAVDSPYSTPTSTGRVATLPELASVRFQKGLRVGMSIAHLETLAGEKGRRRQLGPDREEWTVSWPSEGTGFRVQLRNGRVVAWMQAAAIEVE